MKEKFQSNKNTSFFFKLHIEFIIRFLFKWQDTNVTKLNTYIYLNPHTELSATEAFEGGIWNTKRL